MLDRDEPPAVTTERVLRLHNAVSQALDNAQCLGDALTAIGMLANHTFRQVPPADRLQIASEWVQVLLANVRHSLGKFDA